MMGSGLMSTLSYAAEEQSTEACEGEDCPPCEGEDCPDEDKEPECD